MKPIAGLLTSLGALCATVPLAAQTAPPAEESSSDIVVTGRTEPPPRREVFEQALEVSRVDPGRMYDEALPRFTAPLCPAVSGLSDALADEIVARIRANAARVEVPLARPRCAANLLVAFAEDGRSVLADLQRRHPKVFGLLDEAERGELTAEATPVRVWNVVETRWANGAPLPTWRGKPQVPSARGQANRLLLPTRKDIDFALVVFDREAVLGMSAVQLADYATMRGLSYTRPASGDGPMATILALFEHEEDRGPAELTSFDLGYLRSVYFWDADAPVPAVGRLLSVRRRARTAGEETPEP